MTQDSRHGQFPPTSATLVALARDPGTPGWRQAWERFFRDYWRPLYAWLRRTGTPSSDALELLQDFFAAGLDGKLLSAWEPERGRLRTFLLACLTNHRRKAWRRERARPDRESIPWLDGDVLEPAAGGGGVDDADAAFERDWMRCLQERAVSCVEGRLREAQDELGLRVLREWVLAPTRPPANELAATLGLARGPLYTRATRLRQALADEVERRLRWLEARPDVLASERDAVLRQFRDAT